MDGFTLKIEKDVGGIKSLALLSACYSKSEELWIQIKMFWNWLYVSIICQNQAKGVYIQG